MFLFFPFTLYLANAVSPRPLIRSEVATDDHKGRLPTQSKQADAMADQYEFSQVPISVWKPVATIADIHHDRTWNLLGDALGIIAGDELAAIAAVALLIVGIIFIWYYLNYHSRVDEDALDNAASSSQERSGSDDRPLWLLRNLWPAVFIAGIAIGISMPLEDYVSLNFFSQKYTDLGVELIHCEITPDVDYCKKAVNDNVEWKSITGLMAAAVQICLGPSIGMISDAYGRKSVALTINIIHLVPAIAQALFVYFNISLYLWYGLLIFALVPDLAVWLAMISDLIENPESRASSFGVVVVAWQISVLVGMVVGSIMPLHVAIAVAFVLKLLNVAYMTFCLPESLSEERRKPLSSGQLLQAGGLLILFRSWQLRSVTCVFIISQFVNDGLTTVGTSYFQKYLNWTQHDNYMGAILGELSVLTWVGLLLQPFLIYSGEIGVLFVSQGICAVKYTCTYFVTSKERYFALQGTLAGAAGLTFPVAAALKGSLVEDDEQGHIQGAVQTGKNVAGFLGTVCFGALFNTLDTSTAFESSVERKQTSKLIFVFGALLNLCALPIIATLPRDIMQQKTAEDQGMLADDQQITEEAEASMDDQRPLLDDDGDSCDEGKFKGARQ